MKTEAYGWVLPEGDTHFIKYLENAPRWRNERSVYQSAQLTAALSHTLGKRRTAIDIGAHIGLWSFFLAQVFQEVHSFEPVRTFAQCFAENVKAANVILYKTALGEKSGSVHMNVEVENSGMSHINKSGQLVPIERLDDFHFHDVDLIKIDVEGYELNVLKGGENTLLRNKPIVVLEQKDVDRYGMQQYDAKKHLEALGAVALDRIVDDWIMGWKE